MRRMTLINNKLYGQVEKREDIPFPSPPYHVTGI